MSEQQPDRTGGGTADEADSVEAGEVTSKPSEKLREADPGSVGREFGDRAAVAPDDDIAHPSI